MQLPGPDKELIESIIREKDAAYEHEGTADRMQIEIWENSIEHIERMIAKDFEKARDEDAKAEAMALWTSFKERCWQGDFVERQETDAAMAEIVETLRLPALEMLASFQRKERFERYGSRYAYLAYELSKVEKES